MPVASPEVYAEMLDRAKAGGFAYPAINVTSSGTLNAALRGFAEAESDGILQVSWGGAEFASGASIKNMVDRRGRAGGVRRGGREELPGHGRRCTPTTAPRRSSPATCGRCSSSRSSG